MVPSRCLRLPMRGISLELSNAVHTVRESYHGLRIVKRQLHSRGMRNRSDVRVQSRGPFVSTKTPVRRRHAFSNTLTGDQSLRCLSIAAVVQSSITYGGQAYTQYHIYIYADILLRCGRGQRLVDCKRSCPQCSRDCIVVSSAAVVVACR